MNLTLRIYPAAGKLITNDERARISAWHHAAFSHLPLQSQYEWAAGGDFDVLLDVDGTFSGYLGLIKRQVRFDGMKTVIGGVRGLVIDPAGRGKGLGRAMMAEAHKVIFRTLKADYGFLFCLKGLEPFYCSIGWAALSCPVMVENRGRKVAWTESAMILGKEPGFVSAFPNTIDLMGKPF
jgi:GNAT superfamily N-acetyltransferase